MKNPLHAANWKVSSVFLFVWLVLATAYVGQDLYSMLAEREAVAQVAFGSGVQQGQQMAVQQIITQASDCKPFDVFVGKNRMKLQALNCTPSALAPAAEAVAQ